MNNNNNNNSNDVFHTQRQSYIKICERISKNDPTLSCVELCNEYNLDIKKLSNAISKNKYVTNLNLRQSTFIMSPTTTVSSTREDTRNRNRNRNRSGIFSWIRSIVHPHNNNRNDHNDHNNHNNNILYYLFMEGLIHNTSIVTLDLSETNIFHNDPLFELGSCCGIQNNHSSSKIENLHLARCYGINDNSLQQIMISLKLSSCWGMMNKKLKSIDISGNKLSNGTTIRQLVMNNAPNLIHLNISNNSFHTKGINQFVSKTMMNNEEEEEKGEGRGGFLNLKFCDLSSNCIIDERLDNDEEDNNNNNNNENENDVDNKASSSSSLSSLLKLGVALADNCCNLHELRLDNNKLMDCISLAYGLKRNKSLEILSLNKNCICDVGVIRLTDALFGVVDDGVGDDVELNTCTTTTTTTTTATTNLKRLDLSNNKIHNKGALALVGKSTTLTKIDLSGNCITDCRNILCKVFREEDDDTSDDGSKKNKNKNKKNIILEQLHLTRNNHIPVNQIHEIGFWMKLNASGCRRIILTTNNNKDNKNTTNTKTKPSLSSGGVSGDGGGGDGGYFLSVCPIILNKLASINDPSCLYYFLNRKPEIFSSFFATTCVQTKEKERKGDQLHVYGRRNIE